MSSAAEQRQAVIDIRDLTEAEIAAFMLELRDASPSSIQDALQDVLPQLVDEYGGMAATLGADWYDEMRDAARARGRFRAEPIRQPGPARYEAVARWGVDPLRLDAPDFDAALERVSSATSRIVGRAHSLTVVQNTRVDPQAKGWRRIGNGGTCRFCRMLIDRGAVYRKDSATFKSHYHCKCTAAPAWDAGREVQTVAYVASQRRVTDRDRARVRAWLDANYPE